MNPNRPQRLMAPPPPYARAEIAKALHALAVQEEAVSRAHRDAEIHALRGDLEDIRELLRKARAEWRFQLKAELRKYSPDQPRVPKGYPHGGEWTAERVDADVSLGESGAPVEGSKSDASLRYAELGTGTLTDATATIETPFVPSGGTPSVSEQTSGAAVRAQSSPQTAWSKIQSAMNQIGEANLQNVQSEIQFQQAHPWLILGSAAAPFAVLGAGTTLPELTSFGELLGTTQGPSATFELARQIADVERVPMRFFRTISLLETAEGSTLVAGGSTDLSAAQISLAKELGLVPVAAPGLHAEMTAISGAVQLGLKPTMGISTNIICPRCAVTIYRLSGALTGPRSFLVRSAR